MIDQKFSKLDPINSAIWLVIFNITVLQETRPQIQLVYSAEAILFSIMVLRVSASTLVGMSRRIILLPSMLLIFHLFAHPGNLLFNFGPIQVTDEGVLFGVLYFLRFFNAVLAAIAFALSIQIEDLMASLARIGLPDRATLSIYLTFRYIPLMTAEANIIWAAVRIRLTYRQRTGLRESIDIFSQYLATLVLRAVERAETTALAIQYRQFGAIQRRTHVSSASWKPSHLCFLFPHAIIAAWAWSGVL